MRERLRRLWKSKWRRWLIAAPIGFVFFSIGSVELTSQSFFCNSCHIMNPYYESWKKGVHKDVECVKCHISPGVDNFLTAKLNGLGQVVDDTLHRTSTKPSASVSLFSCTRSGCHAIERVKEQRKLDGIFKFNHGKHVLLNYQGIQLACGSCHSHIKGNDHFAVNTNVCITCHLLERPSGEQDPASAPEGPRAASMIRLVVRENGRPPASDAPPAPETPDASHAKKAPASCTTCHEPPEGVLERNGLKVDHAQFLSYGAACESCHRGTTATPEPIEDSRCLECHTFGIDRSLPTVQMHRVHNEGRHKIECQSCHGDTRHGPSQQTATMQQFECRMCHSGQHRVQRQTYLADGTDHTAEGAPAVSPMFMSHVSCTGCHVHDRAVSVKPDSGATVAAAVAEACDQCHRPGTGKKMVPLWQKATHKLYDQLAADLLAAESNTPPVDQELLGETRRLLVLVRTDGSWGVHNPRYTQYLLQTAREKLARSSGRPVPEPPQAEEPAQIEPPAEEAPGRSP